jgi:hypothetical protein
MGSSHISSLSSSYQLLSKTTVPKRSLKKTKGSPTVPDNYDDFVLLRINSGDPFHDVGKGGSAGLFFGCMYRQEGLRPLSTIRPTEFIS